MISRYFWVFLLTFIPFLELRYSIPVGIFTRVVNLPFGYQLVGYGLNPLTVFLVAVIANFLVAILAYYIWHLIHELLLRTRIINRIYERKLNKLHKKVSPMIEKYGILGLALFISIPLPGSGVYSGALAAYILGMDYKDYLVASLIGVMIAGIFVTLASVFAFTIW